MRRRELFVVAAAFAVTVVFFCLLIRILLLRYERGDVYPAYSTLRADPLGTRAYFEALGTTGQFEMERGFSSVRRETVEKPDTVFYLGLSLRDLESFSEEEVDALDTYVRNGGRIVITFDPDAPSSAPLSLSKEKSANQPFKKDPKKSEKPVPATGKTQQERYEREQFRKVREDASQEEKRIMSDKYDLSLPALWGFGWEVRQSSSSHGPDAPDDAALRTADATTEARVPWKSKIHFVRLESDWGVRYYEENRPVLIGRSWGHGAILVASDSYFLSNEALRSDRRPALLSLVAGAPGRLLFDEVHLGTEKKEGVMILAQKFRLEGYLYGIIAVAALFLWRNSISLVPPRPVSTRAVLGGAVSGKDSRSGLVNLLRRNIAASDLLRTCLAEWKRGIKTSGADRQSKALEMEGTLTACQGRPIVEAYNQLRAVNVPSRAKGSYATKS